MLPATTPRRRRLEASRQPRPRPFSHPVLAACISASLALATTSCANRSHFPSTAGIASALSAEGVVLDAPRMEQSSQGACGLACLASFLAAYGVEPDDIAQQRFTPERVQSGIAAGEIRDYLRSRDFRAVLVEGSLDHERPAGILALLDRGHPVIVELVEVTPTTTTHHFVLVLGYDPDRKWIIVMDPERGFGAVPYERFEETWARSDHLTLAALPPADGTAAPSARKLTSAGTAPPQTLATPVRRSRR